MSTPSLTYQSPVNFNIPQSAPSGIKDQQVAAALQQVYNSMQQIIFAFVNNCGIGPQPASNWSQLSGVTSTLLRGNMNRFYSLATETILYGAVINLYATTAAQIAVRNAVASDHLHWADGYCNVPSGVVSGGYGEFILKSGVIPVNGATVGSRYWLSTAAGNINIAAVTGAGMLEQYIGIALTSKTILMDIAPGINH